METEAPSPLADGSYELVERLGRGASAEVWLARDAAGTELTLKVARDPSHATTLAREALVASLAASPHLPALVGVTTVKLSGSRAAPARDGQPAILLRHVPGESLETDLGDRAPDEARRMIHDVASALGALHELGIAHADVKPANVILDPDGRAHLIDLGLAGPLGARDLEGATPRYLARGDRDLGDARARDLLALGLTLVELVDADVAGGDDPLAIAREVTLPQPLGRIAAGLLAPAPAARPSARWVAEVTGEGRRDLRDGPARVRATYLRLRHADLGAAATCREDVARWLAPAIETMTRLRELCERAGAPPPPTLARAGSLELGPLGLQERRRWLVSLVGATAITWPATTLEDADEPTFAEALCRLAERRPPESWSVTDVEAAIRGDVPDAISEPAERPTGEAALTELALALSRRPTDRGAIAVVERHALSLPEPLRLAAADALRLSGHLGRARALVDGVEGGGAIAADILRRSGDAERAEAAARRAIQRDDPDGRARAVLARCLFDRGALDEAAEVVGDHPRHAAVAEVAALVAHARDQPDRALELAERGVALADTPENRARCAGALGHVTRHRDPAAYLAAYRAAALHAMEAGAVLEEASYRTGEAAALVDAGAIGAALETAERAAMLWDEVLGRPEMAARAWLARAAAFATIDASPETVHAAERAIRLATLAGDARAEAHAHWAIADALSAGAPDAIRAVERVVEISGDQGYDADHSAARLWRHAPDALDARRRAAIDERCRHATATSDLYVRLTWWAARAERLVEDVDDLDEDATEARLVLAELVALADAKAPVGTHGKAMASGCRLATAVGATDSLARLDEARRRDASRVLDGLHGALADKARAAAWLGRVDGSHERDAARGERAIDLQGLVRALSERDELQTLLDRVVDVLLMWTGAERGLLLMPDADGELQPRSARNLARHDLRDEQLAMSSSLARRAMDSGEPVVAVDAMAELSSSYDSVHALKLRSVLAVPLAARGEQLGCVYLDDRLRRGAFGDEQVTWARSVAPVAALAISDARMQVALKEAVERAQRASSRLEELLAHKESELDVAQRRLAEVVPGAERYGIIGDSDEMRRVLTLIERVAKSNVPVLLRGESGSGKELVARAVHDASDRAEEPFVGENCGALPETLLESALFGHVKGAFTGADRPRVGLFEAAHGGTLFLDEIGEMSLGMQTKLLRVLEDNVVRPVGSTQTKLVDVRILAATHRDLEEMVAEGTFREDLYYRLNVITIAIPPLRERPSDVPLLVRHLLDKHATDRSVGVTRDAMRELMRYPWPGNVRQLENEVRRALLMADDVIDVDDLSLGDAEGASEPQPEMVLDIRTRIDQLETQLVKQAMGRTGDNQTQAAKLLGVSRYGLHKMMKRLGLKD